MEEGKEEPDQTGCGPSSKAGMYAVATKTAQDPAVHLKCLFSICVWVLFHQRNQEWFGLEGILLVISFMSRDTFHRAEYY